MTSTTPRFTLRQAVAWIIWKEPDRRISPELPEDKDTEALKVWLEERWRMEARVQVALVELREKISTGAVGASGMRVVHGSPGSGGAMDATPNDLIAPGLPPESYVIPIEWLEVSDGAWLQVRDEVRNGWDTGPYFCRVTVGADYVRSQWPAAVVGQDALVACMTAKGCLLLKERGRKPNRQELIDYCVETTKCRNDDAEAAHKLLREELRRKRGERSTVTV